MAIDFNMILTFWITLMVINVKQFWCRECNTFSWIQVNILVLMWPCRNEIFLSLCIFIMLMISNSWAQLGLSKHLWPFLTNHEYMYTIGNHISAYSLSSKKVTNEIFIWFQPLRHSNFFFFNCWFACILYTKSFI